MFTFKQIIINSLESTSRNPRWWIFGLVQTLSFFIISSLNRSQVLFSYKIFWLLGFILVLQPITVSFWLEIQARTQNKILDVSLKSFLSKVSTSLYLTLFSTIIIIVVRLVMPFWVLLAGISSLVSATACMAALYTVLYGQTLENSLSLSMSTWSNKISLAAIVTFVLILGNAVSFAVAHGMGLNLAGLSHSATIFMLFALAAIGLAFCAAFINCFLVLLFLNFVESKKQQEKVADTVDRLANLAI